MASKQKESKMNIKKSVQIIIATVILASFAIPQGLAQERFKKLLADEERLMSGPFFDQQLALTLDRKDRITEDMWRYPTIYSKEIPYSYRLIDTYLEVILVIGDEIITVCEGNDSDVEALEEKVQELITLVEGTIYRLEETFELVLNKDSDLYKELHPLITHLKWVLKGMPGRVDEAKAKWKAIATKAKENKRKDKSSDSFY